mmetsp:Transcript_21553/g.45316  ORF Transcript_21553/g.45316 Transcript_21553/m.45316 type:complete len:359 (+) Transcript_21553:101-1177(+)|eukprot:CAMPEP_0171353486 /NCGR_PEP_ID=MMETSP0878-20121228/44214_1 /TAXON_ID=67004 /ORGANISM="Thalassiosira weissflogii, Strain CCMP1336" /LENGTH=358 /DNA_ID=CAMNT_0011859431 /DNA_START=69 /DNA_END=1145 /DNA_ORIENTATION=+
MFGATLQHNTLFAFAIVLIALITSWCEGFQLTPFRFETRPGASKHSFRQLSKTFETSTLHQISVSQSKNECSSHGEDPSSLQRRLLVTSTIVGSLIPLTLSNANAAETAAETIRIISAKNIPGLGPPDVYYPAYFVGKWKVTRVISNSDDKLWQGINLPVKLEHEMRFVPYDAYNSEDGGNTNNVPAIADRAFNERSYYDALSSAYNGLTSKSLPSIQTSDWTPANPNVLSLTFADGSSKEIKVTKRSSDVSKDGSTAYNSEFRRITSVPASPSGSVGGIPSIFGSRILSKWKKGAVSNNEGNGDVNLIEGIEILYNEVGKLGDNDPLRPSFYGNSGSKDLADWRITKTNILMERISG